MALIDKIRAIADGFRSSRGTTKKYSLDDMAVMAAENVGGIDTSDATATENYILSPYTAYANGEKLTGTIPTQSQSSLSAIGATVKVPPGYYPKLASMSIPAAEPTAISMGFNSATGTVTAIVEQHNGYVTGGTYTKSYDLDAKSEETIIPGTEDQTIASGTYLTGEQTIKGDANLIPENIAEGVTIFNVTGIAKSVGITDVRIEEVNQSG